MEEKNGKEIMAKSVKEIIQKLKDCDLKDLRFLLKMEKRWKKRKNLENKIESLINVLKEEEEEAEYQQYLQEKKEVEEKDEKKVSFLLIFLYCLIGLYFSGIILCIILSHISLFLL